LGQEQSISDGGVVLADAGYVRRVGIDILCRPKDGISPVGLALPGVSKADVPPGAMIYSIDDNDLP
jgi:hypothetical protein